MAEWRNTQGLTARQLLDIPPVWLLGCILLTWLVAGVLPAASISHWALSYAGGALFWAGLALILWAVWHFVQQKTSAVPHTTPERLITTGPFAFSRNPIYLGDLMVLAGVCLSHGAWLALPLVPVLMAILSRRFIAPEEARMKHYFGAEFEAYAQKTSRWL